MTNKNSAVDSWRTLGTVQPSALEETRLQIHWAAQVVSALGKTFIEVRPDDSHPNFSFSPERGLLVGHMTETTPGLHAALSIPENELLLLDASRHVVARQKLSGLTLEDAFAWLEQAVDNATKGALTGPLDRTLYELPDHPVGSGRPFANLPPAELAELCAWYHDADLVLQAFVAKTPRASDVRIWPHHFDSGCIVMLEDGDPASARSVGMGMTPGDDYYGEPYFYVNPYPRPADEDLPLLPAGAVWHDRDWFGAVLPGHALAAVKAPHQSQVASSYLDASFAAATKLLRR